ncbi:ABC transporter ATP-binding protein [Acidimangrovimonas pyrenivorans]|uniref:ABC transporter ATP-binding protein n=1 Tax=Acidimangrovimonas pyrenivorans TaxID=2030798 RepID=A0ABV7AKZ1_9RHOB
MLEVRDLHAGYGRVEVLRGVSLDLAAGEIVALLGANGVGKTTFNGVLSGLLKPWSGGIALEGAPLPAGDTKAALDAGLVLVPEGRHIFPNLTVRENLWLGGYRRGRANRARNLDHVLDTFPRLAERLAQRAGTMSGGEQQMLAIGRGLMAEPRLLILDEPSLGLSPILVEEMFALIGRLNADGLTILLVEQNVHLTLEVAHRGFVMENGAITVTGSAPELLADPDLQRSYLGV